MQLNNDKLNKNIEEVEIVFIDLETTGLNVYQKSAVCELAAIKVKERKIIKEYHSLVNPQQKIPAFLSSLHGIFDRDVENAPLFIEVLNDFLPMLENSVICGYNIEFDLTFINYELEKHNLPPLSNYALDILPIVKSLLKLPRYSLVNVAEYFGLKEKFNFHHAKDDVLASFYIFLKLVDLLKEKGIFRLEDYLKFCKKEDNLFLIFFEIKKAIEEKKTLLVKFNYKESLEKITPLFILKENNENYLIYKKEQKENILKSTFKNIQQIKIL